MTAEEQLREALRAESAGVEVDPRAWERVRTRVARRRAARAVGVTGLVAAALVGVVLAAGVLFDDDTDRVSVVAPSTSSIPSPSTVPSTTVPPATASTTTTASPPTVPSATTPTTTATAPSTVPSSTAVPTTTVAPTTVAPTTVAPTTVAPTTVPPADGVFRGIWPFSSQAAVDAFGSGTSLDATSTALAFARDYLAMPDPSVVEPFVATGPGEGHVVIRSRPGPALHTTVELWTPRDGGPWVVVGATCGDIVVDQPRPLDVIGGRVVLTGRSDAFEAVVNVEVREDGATSGEVLGSTIVMGGGSGELEPFAGDVVVSPATAPAGAVVFVIYSAEDGTVVQASVVRVRFET